MPDPAVSRTTPHENNAILAMKGRTKRSAGKKKQELYYQEYY
jgi:hypothetical protein